MTILYALSGLWKGTCCQVVSLWQRGQESENPLRTARGGQGHVEASVRESVTVRACGDTSTHRLCRRIALYFYHMPVERNYLL